MRHLHCDGKDQVTAGLCLLELSRLVQWDKHTVCFSPASETDFESSWPRIHRKFGRVICWMNFSAGAEFLAKGVCLLNGVEIRQCCEVPAYPTDGEQNLSLWAKNFRDNQKCGKMPVTKFGTLGDLYKRHLITLCEERHAHDTDRDLVIAAYKLLAMSIRNRDAHAYVPDVRGAHFNLVPQLFTQCFDILVSWLPDGPATLNQWTKDAR